MTKEQALADFTEHCKGCVECQQPNRLCAWGSVLQEDYLNALMREEEGSHESQ